MKNFSWFEWMLYLLIVLMMIGVGKLTFWWIKRTTKPKPEREKYFKYEDDNT